MRFISVIDHYNSERDEGRLAWERLTAQGKYMAGQALYGYRKKKKDKHKLEPDPETALVFLHGKGEIVNRKCGFGMMCWMGGVINGLLQNGFYTGAVVSLKITVDAKI